MKRYLISVIIREMPIKTTMRYHLRPIRMATMGEKTEKSKCGEDVEKLELLCIVGENGKMVQPLWKTVWRFPQKLKIELSYDTAILLLGNQKNYY